MGKPYKRSKIYNLFLYASYVCMCVRVHIFVWMRMRMYLCFSIYVFKIPPLLIIYSPANQPASMIQYCNLKATTRSVWYVCSTRIVTTKGQSTTTPKCKLNQLHTILFYSIKFHIPLPTTIHFSYSIIYRFQWNRIEFFRY